MPTDVRCVVEPDDRYAVVRLVGILDPPAAEALRGALLTCLADQSTAVVVDVSELSAPGPAGYAVLTGVAREAADWPVGRPVFYAGAEADRGEAEVVAPATADEAYALLDEPAQSRRLGLDLEPVTGAARLARELVADGCARWGVPELIEPGYIAVTEMVNNVVAHAHTAMSVRLGLHDGRLHVAVRDRSPRRPTYTGPVSPTSWGGRGLLLIDNVSRRWGSAALDDGKVVWAVLDPDDEAGA